MPITPLPTLPLTSDPTTFDARADALFGALPNFITEVNALPDEAQTLTNKTLIAPIIDEINDTPIGQVTPRAGLFTTLTVGGKTLSLSGNFATTGAFNATFALPLTATYTLPNFATAILATVSNLAQTFVGTTTFSSATVTVGTAVIAATYGLGTGITTTGVTKTVNIGIAGASGSTTNVNIGSATAGALGTTTLNSLLVLLKNTPTGSAPAYVKGGVYFDSTLNKLRIGGATAWETVTSV
jgi:hypothetical protein